MKKQNCKPHWCKQILIWCITGKRVIPALTEGFRRKLKETIQIDANVHHGGTLVAMVLRNHGVK